MAHAEPAATSPPGKPSDPCCLKEWCHLPCPARPPPLYWDLLMQKTTGAQAARPAHPSTILPPAETSTRGRESRRGRCLLESFPPIADPPPPVPGSHSCDRVFLPQLGPLICVSISSVSSHRPLGRCFLPAKHDECSLPELGHLWSVGRRALAKQSPLPVHYSHKPDSQRRSTS